MPDFARVVMGCEGIIGFGRGDGAGGDKELGVKEEERFSLDEEN